MPGRQSTSQRSIALLRGINVGGKNLVPMAGLAACFECEGCTGVRTYNQSGNVIFTAPARGEGTLANAISQRIFSEWKVKAPVIIRSAEEWKRIVAACPFAVDDPKQVHVMFLAEAPSAALVKALDSERSPGDTFVVKGAEIYLHLPRGVSQSRLTNAYFDAALKTVSTSRNWTTVTKLAALAAE